MSIKFYTVRAKSIIYGYHFVREVKAYSPNEAVAKFERNYPTAFAVDVDGEKIHR